MNRHENWLQQREKKAFLALEDGSIFHGYSVGAARDTVGEVVFNTGMTGYQEIISDPSYAGQLVTMTYPEIGNTGMTPEDMESRGAFASGLIVHAINPASNFRSREDLRAFLDRHDIPAIAGVDTRALTTKLRHSGTLKGVLAVTGTVPVAAACEQVRQWEGLDGQDYASRVTCDAAYQWDEHDASGTTWGIADQIPPATLKIVAWDFGIKWNILRHMRLAGMAVTVVPARTPAAEVLAMKPDGVFLSNGPADPAGVTYAIENARALLGTVPLMGICLGHQILSLAAGARTYRLKFGHHGCNHPVQDLATGEIQITSQNHNFAVDENTLEAAGLEVTHRNLNDHTVEGIRHRREPLCALQYHPEAGPGPHDATGCFNALRALIEGA